MNTIKFLNSQPVRSDNLNASLAAIRSTLFSTGVCWTDSAQGQFEVNKPFRVVLHTRNAQVDFKNPMVKECNGLVFEYNNGWKLLAMPQPAFCTNKISMKKLNDIHASGGYDVYEVLDATILTLYYYDTQWRVSSTKGYDIGFADMVNGMTYIDAIYDLMDTKYKAFRFEDLNKSFSYTVALRHSKYHIFDETKHLANRTKNVPRPGVDMNSYLMIMCIADTTSATYVVKHVPGLPSQNPIALKDSNINTLTGYARSAYAKFAKAYRLKNFKYKPLYGYILRAKHRNVPNEYSTIYIESELFRFIKIGLYKNNQAIRSLDYNRLVIQMSMNHEKSEQFQIMFQQFEDKFQLLNATINSIAVQTAEKIISDGSEDAEVKMETAMDIDEMRDPTVNLIRELADRFKTEPDVTLGVIKDAIYAKKYTDYLFDLFK